MDTTTLLRILDALDACDEAREWVATQPDAATAWATCPHANWLMVLLGEMHVRGALPRETLVLAACACAETALCHVPAGEHRPRLAIEAARRWTRGEATVAEVSSAAAAAACAAVYSAAAAADAAAAGTLFLRTGFIDGELAAAEIGAVKFFSRGLGFVASAHGDEREATGATGHLVHRDVNVGDGAELTEGRTEFVFSGLKGQIADV